MSKTAARRCFVLLALAAAMGSALAQKTTPAPAPKAAPAAAQNWPSKPVRIIVGFPAGSTPDLVARTIAEPLAKELGQPVLVENKVGAGGNIAADQIARATDDHTIERTANHPSLRSGEMVGDSMPGVTSTAASTASAGTS